ncbi:hypothetical protein TBS_25960 [Thermobispora bispora]|nr:DUF3017 domain-containing protein [Actinomycetales bacterium]MDI9579831.1 DUF3017 domain-containing protein [Thermobispora sp.]QSI47333.1 DUF3017 domain-containing protein [Thermobispora bispora]
MTNAELSTRRNGGGFAWGPYLLVLLCAAAGLALIPFGVEPWVSGVVLGGSLVLGAALRLVISDEQAHGLKVRSRKTDVLVLATLGAALVAGSLSLLLPLHRT